MILTKLDKNCMFRKFLPLIALIPVILCASALPQAWFGLLALIGYLLAVGISIGPRLAPNVSRPLQLGIGILGAVAGLSLLGSVIYYSSTVTTESLLAVLMVVAVVASGLYQPSTQPPVKFNYLPLDLLWFALGLLALTGWWFVVLTTHISEPTRSVWLIISPTALMALGLACVSSLVLFLRHQAPGLGTILLALTLFSGLSLVAITYTLGYGFDPFLHRATVLYIAEHGTITPKPLYYIGQYALELFGVKVFALPLFWLDVLLVPALAAFGLVTVLATRQTSLKSPSLVLAVLIFLPLSAFIQTTPQALAFTFTALALLSSPKPLMAPALFALAATITHPLAGISALVYVALLAIDTLPERLRSLRLLGLSIFTLLASISIPVAFVFQARLAHLDLQFSFANVWKLWQLPIDTFLTSHAHAWGDLTYMFIGNSFLIVTGLAILGLVLTPKHTLGWYIPGLVALSTFINFIIVSLGFDFDFLIAYERLDFALRLLTLTTLCLLPYVAVLLSTLWQKLQTTPVGLKLGLASLLSFMLVTNVYAAYPRHDNYARSAGFNVGPADLEAVHAIERASENQDYIVLSDQSLAAAAVQELGFKKYYYNDIFFYPIPTGGPLYQHFLTMVNQTPSRETMTQAMDLAGVNLAFFAIHDYWWQSSQIIENTKVIADDWFAIGDGNVTVFIFSSTE